MCLKRDIFNDMLIGGKNTNNYVDEYEKANVYEYKNMKNFLFTLVTHYKEVLIYLIILAYVLVVSIIIVH